MAARYPCRACLRQASYSSAMTAPAPTPIINVYPAAVSSASWIVALVVGVIAATALLFNERNKRITEGDKLSKQLARAAGIRLLAAVEAAYRLRRMPGQSTNPDDAEINDALSEVKIACTPRSGIDGQAYVFAYRLTAPSASDPDRIEDRFENVQTYHAAQQKFIDRLRADTDVTARSKKQSDKRPTPSAPETQPSRASVPHTAPSLRHRADPD